MALAEVVNGNDLEVSKSKFGTGDRVGVVEKYAGRCMDSRRRSCLWFQLLSCSPKR